MSKISLQEITTQVEQLPHLPQAVLKVSQMLELADTSADDLAQVIRIDQNLTSQILRMTNSAAYGLGRKVDTVKEAVAILGFKTLKSLIYAIISHTALDRPVTGYCLKRGDLWSNAVTGAVYAKFLAEKHKLVDPELAFTAALLRDIGKLVLDEYVGGSYALIESYSLQKKVDFVQSEVEVVGFNHMEVGAKVAERWGLPARIISVIKAHHKPADYVAELNPEDLRLVCTVHLADAFTMLTGAGVGSDGLMYSVDTATLRSVGINVDNQYIESSLSQLVDLSHLVKSLSDSLA